MKKSIFGFLESENKYLFNLITEIENIIYTDAQGAILKGRIYAETLCKIIAEESDLEELNGLNQIERIKVLARDEIINDEVENNFHNIRMLGNKAAHGEIEEDLESAISVHRSIYKITCWYMMNYIAFNFKAHQYETPKPIIEEKLNDNNKLEALIGEFKELLIHNKSAVNVEEKVNVTVSGDKEAILDMISEQYDEINSNTTLNSSINNNEEKVEENFSDIDLREGDSAYIFYCKLQLQKYLSVEQWNLNNSNGCISIYNKIFREKFMNVNPNLASKLKLQIWMKRPQKERTSLQVEIAGAGPEYKELKLKLANSLKSRFSYDKDIILGKETVGIVMTLNIKVLGIVDNTDDTTDKLSLNNESIQDSVKKFIGYLDMNIINEWIVNDAVPIINSYKHDVVSSLVEGEVIKQLKDKSIEILDGGTGRMKKLITQSERMNIEGIERKVKRGNIVLDPSFQRNYVYTDEKAASVIQSIILNMPLGVVYLAEIDKKNLCVDGQQRLTSILRYINNEFPLKKLDVLTEFIGLYFKDLSEEMKDVIYDYSMEITKIKECDYEQIYFLYEKLNVGSVKLNAQEIRRCVYAGHFNDMLEQIVADGIVVKHFNEIENIRLKRVEVLINALAVADNPNYKCSRKKLLNDYMEKHKDYDEKAVDNKKNNILRVFRLIEDVLGDRAFKFKDKDILTLTLVYPIYCCFSNLNEKDIRFNADNIRADIINLTQANVCIFNPNGNVNGDVKGVKYTLDRIEDIILNSIGKNCDTRTRIFPKEWRERLLDKQEGICGICNQKILDIGNTEIDHIIPFSKGGETILDNAQLTHIHCNRSKNNRI